MSRLQGPLSIGCWHTLGDDVLVVEALFKIIITLIMVINIIMIISIIKIMVITITMMIT